jgi:hypothetical protein
MLPRPGAAERQPSIVPSQSDAMAEREGRKKLDACKSLLSCKTTRRRGGQVQAPFCLGSPHRVMEAWSIFGTWDLGIWGGWPLTFAIGLCIPALVPCLRRLDIGVWTLSLKILTHFRPMPSILFSPPTASSPSSPPIGRHPTVSRMQSSFVLDACSFANCAHFGPGVVSVGQLR